MTGDDTGIALSDVSEPSLARAKMPTEETMVSAEIDAILKRLDEGIPQMFEDMKALRKSLRRPLAV